MTMSHHVDRPLLLEVRCESKLSRQSEILTFQAFLQRVTALLHKRHAHRIGRNFNRAARYRPVDGMFFPGVVQVFRSYVVRK